MKKLFLILSLSFAILSLCLSQSSVWKLEGKGNTVFIGGTMHLLSVEDYPLPTQFDSDPVELVLVGALHLHGPDGILSMLKKKGYKVSQL